MVAVNSVNKIYTDLAFEDLVEDLLFLLWLCRQNIIFENVELVPKSVTKEGGDKSKKVQYHVIKLQAIWHWGRSG